MLTLFHAPGSCSLGILALLHEVGAPFEVELVDLGAGAQREPAYKALNPKGKVPALRLESGEVLTEFPAIALWLAESYPEAGLAPADPLARARMIAAMDFVVSSIHMRGFTFVNIPQRFTSVPEAQEELRAHGRKQFEAGLVTLEAQMGQGPWLLGEIGPQDFALFYVLAWARRRGFAVPAGLDALFDRMLARPSVARALEGADGERLGLKGA